MENNSEDNRPREKTGFSNRKRSIRDISLSEELRGKRRPARDLRGTGSRKSYYKRGSNAARYGVLIFAIVAIVFGGILAMSVFARATLTIEPKSQRISVDEEVTISEAGAHTGGIPLTYEIFSVEEVSTKTLAGKSEEHIERFAQGKITIYNTDSADQPLVAKTRFESDSGEIYRISDSILVPAAKSAENPGSITVSVTADAVGESSNLSQGKLTIPGLEGTALFTKMYAEVDSALSGGFSGIERTVGEAEEEAARKEMQSSLMASLEEKVVATLPKEYLLVPNSTFFEFEELPSEVAGENVTLRSKATIYGVMLKRDLFAGYLATEYLEEYTNSPLEILDPENLAIEIDKKQLTFSDVQEEITLSISGDVTLRWKIDEDFFRQAISGMARTEAIDVAVESSSVEGAKLELVPRFLRTVPTNEEKIDIVMVDEL